MNIDANMYWLPDKLFTDQSLMDRFMRSIPWGMGFSAYLKTIDDDGRKQFVIEMPKGYQNLNYVEGQYDVETQINDMDKAGVDLAILKTPGCQEWLDLELCKVFNDGLANHVAKGKNRFRALAVVPPWGTKECLNELDRCIHELGMTGVQLSAKYGKYYLDHEVFKPFFARVNELNIPAYIHHTALPVEYDSIYEFTNMRRSFGRCSVQITAIGREVYSGMFEAFPNLKFVHSMLGGGLFSFYNLMFPGQQKKKEVIQRLNTDNEKIHTYLKNNIFYEMSQAIPWGKINLEFAIKILGAEKIVFGSSYPVHTHGLIEGPSFIDHLDISSEEKQKIMGINAENIYQLSIEK